MKATQLQLCPSCYTMKKFTGDVCVRCERDKQSWREELKADFGEGNYIGAPVTIREMEAFIAKTLSQQKAELLEILKDSAWVVTTARTIELPPTDNEEKVYIISENRIKRALQVIAEEYEQK